MLETWKAKKQQYYCIGPRHLDFMKLFWTRKDKELTENNIWNRNFREDFSLSKSLNLHFHQYTVYFLSQQAVSHLFWRTEILSFPILNFTQLRQPDFVILFASATLFRRHLGNGNIWKKLLYAGYVYLYICLHRRICLCLNFWEAKS